MTSKPPLWFDLETYSTLPISVGSYRYAEQADILLFAYAIGDEPPRCWDRTSTKTMPADLRAALESDCPIWGHNAGQFDRIVLKHFWPIDPARLHDSMVLAYLHGLPGSLDDLCDILGVPQDARKLKVGRKLVLRFCKPAPKRSKVHRFDRITHPEEWALFIEYAKHDIVAMREVVKRIPKWNWKADERAYWLQDQRRNDRGVKVDMDLVDGALTHIDRESKLLNARTRELTAGEVGAASQRDVMLKHIFEEYGIPLPDLQASTVERRLEDPELPEPLKDLLRVRLDTTTTSTSKYKRIKSSVCRDGRLHGLIQFCGAIRTARDAGRIIQPQNLPRPSLDEEEIEFGIEALLADCADIVCDNVMALCSSTLRGTIIAEPGKKLCVADLSNIEGRKLAWVAGEKWKIKAFREFDRGIGADLYNVAYARSFNIDVKDVTKDQRQIGKVQELALGYEGGAGAYAVMALAYGINLDELAAKAKPNIPAEVWEEAESLWFFLKAKEQSQKLAKGQLTRNLKQEAFIACDALKRLWRMAHPETVALWTDLETICRLAMQEPGTRFTARGLTAVRNRNWLRVILPSGRSMCYPGAQLDEFNKLSYMGVNQWTRKWTRIKTYGGKLTENVVQASSRDVFKHGEVLAEDAGYAVVLPVHDELVAEVPDTDEYSAEGLAECMSTVPSWAKGLPLAAKGFESYRYRKD